MNTLPPDAASFELRITRVMSVSRAALWRAWSEPDHLREWWCPKPWTTEVLAFDMRAGGAFHTRMHGPEGGLSDNPGSFVEVVPQQRIAFTSLLLADWQPAPTPWMPMSAIFTFDDAGDGRTRYIARALHPDAETRDKHAEMGFAEGWGICADQLEAFARTL